jgi:hypothetical protein
MSDGGGPRQDRRCVWLQQVLGYHPSWPPAKTSPVSARPHAQGLGQHRPGRTAVLQRAHRPGPPSRRQRRDRGSHGLGVLVQRHHRDLGPAPCPRHDGGAHRPQEPRCCHRRHRRGPLARHRLHARRRHPSGRDHLPGSTPDVRRTRLADPRQLRLGPTGVTSLSPPTWASTPWRWTPSATATPPSSWPSVTSRQVFCQQRLAAVRRVDPRPHPLDAHDRKNEPVDQLTVARTVRVAEVDVDPVSMRSRAC